MGSIGCKHIAGSSNFYLRNSDSFGRQILTDIIAIKITASNLDAGIGIAIAGDINGTDTDIKGTARNVDSSRIFCVNAIFTGNGTSADID